MSLDTTKLNIRRRDGLKLFTTSYQEGEGFYGAEIEASSLEHAEQIALARRLGERIEGERTTIWVGRIGELIETGEYVAAAHEAAFMCFIALQAGVITPREALGDEGLVHELLHFAAGDTYRLKPRLRRAKILAKQIAHRIPGYPVSGWPDRETPTQGEA